RPLSATLSRRGTSSSVLAPASPIFASRDPPQQAQVVGASITTRSCSMSSGQGLRTGRLRVKARTFCAFAAAACAASLARRGDEFFELQFQLLDQPRRA